jgi:hypothetical protein
MPRQGRLDAPGLHQHVMARGIEKTAKVVGFLNVSQSAISKCLLCGEKAVKENNGIVDQIFK